MRTTRRTHNPCQVRHFTCLVCGATNPATKTRGRTPRGHIKTMWCWCCQAETDQEQTD